MKKKYIFFILDPKKKFDYSQNNHPIRILIPLLILMKMNKYNFKFSSYVVYELLADGQTDIVLVKTTIEFRISFLQDPKKN